MRPPPASRRRRPTKGSTSVLAAHLAPVLPEIILAVGAIVLLMVGVFAGGRPTGIVTAGTVAVILVAGLVVAFSPRTGTAFDGVWINDGFGNYMKLLSLVGAGVTLLLAARPAVQGGYDRFELPVLILIATLGMMMMISANDLISLYLGLELQSLAAYVIASIHRDNLKSTEAGLKYFVLGALSSGLLLYGASLVYGFTGTTSFPGIAAAIAAHGKSTGIVFGLVFILAGLSFKISAVPFHMWTPDVYEGAPTPVTAFFAAAPKVAAMALVTRVAVEAFKPSTHDWQQVIVFVSVASMLLGSFAAIGQTNIKRLMAYSSIGHVGYALVGLAAGTADGVQSVVVYMTIYMATTLGAFAMILSMRRASGPVETISDLAGLARTNPLAGFLFSMIVFSLAGVPILAGFFAKLYVFMAAVQAGLVTLAVIGGVASVVGAFYYLRIVKVMYFDEPAEPFLPMAFEQKLVLIVSGVFSLAFVALGSPLVGAATAAAKSFF